jgi:vanillin dehydrogenase
MPLDGTAASLLPGSSSRQRYIQSNITLSLIEKRWTRAGDWSSSLPNATDVMAVNLARRARLHFDEGGASRLGWLGGEDMNKTAFIVDGEAMDAQNGATFERKDPVTGQVATTTAAATIDDVNKVAAAAARAFESWSETGANTRRALLLKAADVMEARTNDFVKLMLEETGATAPWAGFNVHLAAGMLREAAALTTQITGEVIPADKPGVLAMAIRQPVGVVLGIAPWNAPVILGTRAIAAALACGNTVILRSSELCPGTHHLVGQVLNDAGFPKGVVNVLSNAPQDAPKIVEALIAHPAVKRINFTGSTKVGKIIAKLAAEQLKPVLLELGGKAPLIVLDDADLDQAVDAAAFGAFLNQGQICMSTERIIVDEKVADAFVAKLAAKASKLPAGDPRGHVVLGSLVDLAPAERMDVLIADAVEKGAKLVVGGQRKGSIVEATLLDHVTPRMKIYREESFGPVKPIIRVAGAEQAIRVANDTEYGLSAAVFSRDIKRAMAVARKIESGICHVNGPTVADEAQMPFGGMKASGYGRFGGRAVIDEFTELRWITIEGPQHYPF